MVFVGIDVAKDKHDCFIISSEGEVLAEVFTITNNRAGFECLLLRIRSCAGKSEKIKVGLEATGHYSYNILGFLLDNGLDSVVINPLHTNALVRLPPHTNFPPCSIVRRICFSTSAAESSRTQGPSSTDGSDGSPILIFARRAVRSRTKRS